VKLFRILLPVLLLAGCAGIPAPAQVPSAGYIPSISELPGHWQLRGRISLTQGDTGWHAGVDWRERLDEFSLRISGPLGQGGFLLTGNNSGVSLRDAELRTYHAPDVETLLTDVTGWVLPVTGMRYWVRGIPDPSTEFSVEFDDYGRLKKLVQSGWIISYTGFRGNGDERWPARLGLVQGDVSVRMVISAWQLGEPPVAVP